MTIPWSRCEHSKQIWKQPLRHPSSASFAKAPTTPNDSTTLPAVAAVFGPDGRGKPTLFAHALAPCGIVLADGIPRAIGPHQGEDEAGCHSHKEPWTCLDSQNHEPNENQMSHHMKGSSWFKSFVIWKNRLVDQPWPLHHIHNSMVERFGTCGAAFDMLHLG